MRTITTLFFLIVLDILECLFRWCCHWLRGMISSLNAVLSKASGLLKVFKRYFHIDCIFPIHYNPSRRQQTWELAEAFKHTRKDLSNDSSFKTHFFIKNFCTVCGEYYIQNQIPHLKKQASSCHWRVQQNGYFHKNQAKQIMHSNTVIKKRKISSFAFHTFIKGRYSHLLSFPFRNMDKIS